MKRNCLHTLVATGALMAIGVGCSTSPGRQAAAPTSECPLQGWQENLIYYLNPGKPFPTTDTPTNAVDCNFHQWSWEAFVWATALGSNGMPRFMGFHTPEDLLTPGPGTEPPPPRLLKLAARSLQAHGTAGFTEGAGAFVQADGNVLVAPNGYPVYASVHMNPSYFATAKKNLIVNGGYTNQPLDSSFQVGAAVFKATWLRLDAGQQPPAGTFTTQAQVPMLTAKTNNTIIAIVPVPGKFTTVTVALLGLHVVGYTINHPEFLWGTFEHKLNSPVVPDNTFTTNGSNPKNYTLYKANTSFAQVNGANVPPVLTFNPATQRFAPVNNAVLENQTGGENLTNGATNVALINASAQSLLAGLKTAQSVFANYRLNGTVWMPPNTYDLTSNQSNAVGSVNLANVTAETFVQTARTNSASGVQNCFSCHNPTSYSFQANPPPLVNRKIAISHVLGVHTAYAVSNLITGSVTAPK